MPNGTLDLTEFAEAMRDPETKHLSNLALARRYRVKSATIAIWKRKLGIGHNHKIPKRKGRVGWKNGLSRHERERMLQVNLRLAHKRVAVTVARSPAFAHLYEDMLSEAYMGLWIACEKFDPSLGIQFSTYAVTCINRSLMRFMDDCKFAESGHDAEMKHLPDQRTDDPLVWNEDTWQSVIDQVPENYRPVFVKYYREHKTYKQIAKELGHSPARSQQICISAIKCLRSILCPESYR